MFSRRHPYLFFILVFAGIICSSSAIVSFFNGVSDISKRNSGGEGIGVIEINGVILESTEAIEQLRNFRKRKDIKAVVIRINSPGGGVAPSQEIYEAVKRLSRQKKTIASFGSVAASGGYYIASAADYIITNPGTITGSIGVIMEYTNIEEIMGKIGIKPVVIKSGKFKDTGSPVRELRRDEKEFLQNFVDGIHDQFVMDVARGRKKSEEHIRKYADGRIISGKDAVSLGFADKLGNFEDALDFAAKISGIKGGKYKLVYPPKEKLFFLKELIQESASKISQVTFKNRSSFELH